MGAKHGTAEQRLWPKVAKAGDGDCWLWTASISSNGYGCLRVNGVTRTAHTLAWEMTRGPIPHGRYVCHIRVFYSLGSPIRTLATRYGVTYQQVWNIVHNKQRTEAA